MTPNNTVYKLVGPVLVAQDQAEAKNNVDKRLDFIRGDMYVYTLITGRLILPIELAEKE